MRTLLNSFPLTRFTMAVAFGVVLTAGLSACRSSVKLDEAGAPIENREGKAAEDLSRGAPKITGVAPGTANAAATPASTVKDPLTDPDSPLSKRSIYFDYDSFSIRQEFRSLIEIHAKYLMTNKARKVVIQGNTDERGSREYNLALGQKRSEAVRKAFLALGVADGQLEAVSFGEEKPRATGGDDAAMAENRRADLAYQ